MKIKLTLIFTSFFCSSLIAQTIDVDLAEKKGSTIDVNVESKFVALENASNNTNITYKLFWKKRTTLPPLFNTAEFSNFTLENCPTEITNLIKTLRNEKDESKIKQTVATATGVLNKTKSDDCTSALKALVDQTVRPDIKIPFSLSFNQVITLTIRKVDKEKNDSTEWSYTLKTEERSRWLTHFGLTYTPNVISKVDRFFTQDSSLANTYRIAKQNDNGPKPWDNISATINFTYPFSANPRNLDAGFTAGFGLNPTMQLSGHAGFSAIVGTNVILGTGVAFMQKQKLRGEFFENKIVKTNLTFDALHEKVWMPELYFTIGFRFNKNPFGGASDKAKEGTGGGEEKKKAEPKPASN